MKKFFFLFFLLICAFSFCFSAEKELPKSDSSLDFHFSLGEMEKEAKLIRKEERRIKRWMNMAPTGACLTACAAIPGHLILMLIAPDPGLMIELIFPIIPVFSIISIGLLIPGLILLGNGVKRAGQLREKYGSKLFSEKKLQSYQRLLIAGTIVSGIGLLSLCIGGGIIMGDFMLGENKGDYMAFKNGKWNWILCSGVFSILHGLVVLSVGFPLFLTGLVGRNVMKGFESRVSPEISFVPEEKSSARGSSLSPWENSRLSLALKVRF